MSTSRVSTAPRLVEDGILTCHWHHARFDAATGGTFDLWADDVPTAAVELRDDDAFWVCPRTRYTDGNNHQRNRVQQGLQHKIGLILGKAVLGFVRESVDYHDLICDAALFAVHHRDGWGVGLMTLTALGNLLPIQPEEENISPSFTV